MGYLLVFISVDILFGIARATISSPIAICYPARVNNFLWVKEYAPICIRQFVSRGILAVMGR